MIINDLEEFIGYVCSTGSTPDTSLFTFEDLKAFEDCANRGSDQKVEKLIRKKWNKSQSVLENELK